MNAMTNGRNRLVLHALSAEDLMTSAPISLGRCASIREAAAFLMDKGISAAPVIDDAGRPIGVISRSDIVRHAREVVTHVPAAREYFEEPELAAAERFVCEGFQVEVTDNSPVCEIMTPVVFSVAPSTSASNVIEEMLARKVHRLFVVDDAGVLVGVISALDVLRKLWA
jgi:CBS domain-containing protein